jgi:ribosomal protein S12 methylthiotransferase
VKFTLVTLGCDKNTVDSERYIAELEDRGARFTATADDADVILVNTCGFIDAAKKESIDAIIEAGAQKSAGRCQAVVAVGCMVQRHKDELAEALPEVDLFLGASEMDRLVPELEERGLLDGVVLPVAHPGVRTFSGELPHVRYLKISEGCDHGHSAHAREASFLHPRRRRARGAAARGTGRARGESRRAGPGALGPRPAR